MRAALLIPALDEAEVIGGVVREFAPWIESIVVVDNGSRDETAMRAREAGADVVLEPRRGYGSACLAGLRHLAERGPPAVVVFGDGDGACDPADLPALLAPIEAGAAEFVIGTRIARAEPGALTAPQRFGNVLASAILSRGYGVPTTDLGPFRAITWSALAGLEMRDLTYGWTVEMQVKAALQRLATVEVPVAHRVRRGGVSKVSGTLRGVYGAGRKILETLLRYG